MSFFRANLIGLKADRDKKEIGTTTRVKPVSLPATTASSQHLQGASAKLHSQCQGALPGAVAIDSCEVAPDVSGVSAPWG